MALILLLFAAGIGGIGYYYEDKANANMTLMYQKQLLSIEWLNESRAMVRAIDANLFELMVSKDPARRRELETDNARRAVILNQKLEAFEKTRLDSFETETMKKLKQNLQAARNSRPVMMEQMKAGRFEEAYRAWFDNVRQPSEDFQKNLIALSEYNVRMADQISKQNDRDHVVGSRIILGSLMVALFLGLLLAWLIARAITQPLSAATSHVNVMAQGDYSSNVPPEFLARGDEFGLMATAFVKLTQSMRGIIRQVTSSAEQVAAASEELTSGAQQTSEAANNVSSSIQQVARGSENQVVAVNETSAIVQEISVTMEALASTASEMARLSEQTIQAAQEGKGSISRAVSQMDAVSNGSKQAQLAAEELKTSSAQIGEIVNLISSIAGQTNLLALNAAIEAARAGEQGRGFAVVAEEVRKLAEQSEQAARQIKDLVANNHGSIGNVVGAIDIAIKDITQGVALVNVAGNSFGSIDSQIAKVAEKIAVIAKAVDEAADGAHRIVGSIKEVENLSRDAAAESENVSAATEQQSASMEEIAASSHALAQLAQDLQTALAKFRI